jgi:diguanylate cyclase (GGDEF)-like protein
LWHAAADFATVRRWRRESGGAERLSRVAAKEKLEYDKQPGSGPGESGSWCAGKQRPHPPGAGGGSFMRILVADDDCVTQRLLEGLLRHWGDEVVAVSDGLAAWKVLDSDAAPRLAILDWMMPGLDGLEICQRLRRFDGRSYTYVLLLTARTQGDDLIRALEAGADDYLTKPVNHSELRARLQTGRRILGLMEQLVAAQEELKRKASHDALTGAWTRGVVLEILQRELAHGGRERAPLSIIMADLDHFKRVNDNLGHLTGDAVLREAADRLRTVLRGSDWIGRYGGEEFLIVLPDCDLENGMWTAQRLREAIAAEPFHTPEGAVWMTISLGVTATDGKRPPPLNQVACCQGVILDGQAGSNGARFLSTP